MAYHKGQLIVPDLGFYGRDAHVSLIRENRLIAGVRFLDELPEKLRRRLLTIEDKVIRGALYDDAVVLAKAAGLRPDPLREDNAFNKFLDAAMAMPPPALGELWIPPPLQPAGPPAWQQMPRKKKWRG